MDIATIKDKLVSVIGMMDDDDLKNDIVTIMELIQSDEEYVDKFYSFINKLMEANQNYESLNFLNNFSISDTSFYTFAEIVKSIISNTAYQLDSMKNIMEERKNYVFNLSVGVQKHNREPEIALKENIALSFDKNVKISIRRTRDV